MILFSLLLALAALAYGTWVLHNTADTVKDYKIALCDRWREGRWYFHDDAYSDELEGLR